jgi:hypothetical protein
VNVRLIRLFHRFKIIPRYRVKWGDRYQLVGMSKGVKDDTPYAVNQPVIRGHYSDNPVSKLELAVVEKEGIYRETIPIEPNL